MRRKEEGGKCEGRRREEEGGRSDSFLKGLDK